MTIVSSCDGSPVGDRLSAGCCQAQSSGFEGGSGFVSTLVKETDSDRHDFLALPQVHMALSGAMESRTLLAYLEQAYHLERETTSLLQDARDRFSARPDLAEGLDAYISGDADHAEAILEEIASHGGDLRVVRSGRPSGSVAAIIDRARTWVQGGNPVALFGLVFVMECLAVASVRVGAEVACASLGLDETMAPSLLAPAVFEDQTRFFTNLMATIIDPDDQHAIVAGARDIFRLFGSLFARLPLG